MKKILLTPIIFMPLKYFSILWLYCYTPNLLANEQEKIAFYLPFHSSQFSINLDRLNEDFKHTGFDNFTIKTSDIWQQYQQNIRTGESGVYFASPHFAAWLINQHNFVPLLRLDSQLKFVIASKVSDKSVFELSDLIDKKICTQSPLNLDYLLINSAYKRSIQIPDAHLVISVKEEFDDPESHCSAFSISEHIYLQHESEAPNQFIRLAQSKVFNNYAFLIHPSLAKEYSLPLITFLSKESSQQELNPFLKLFSQKTSFIEAKASDYPKEYLEELSSYWTKNE